MKLSVILPAYNEEQTIAQVIEGVLGQDLRGLPAPVEKEIIVVDDCSRDRTAEIVARYEGRVRFLRHSENRGKGAAIQTALHYATGEVVLIQDADLEYLVSDYPALIRPFFDPAVQVVYGSRFLLRRHPTNMRWSNFIANRILTHLANILYGSRLTDEATCYKLFRADLIESLPLKASGFDFCPEVTSLVRRRKIAIREVPVDYTARTMAEGKKVRWTDGVKAVMTLLAYRFRRQ